MLVRAGQSAPERSPRVEEQATRGRRRIVLILALLVVVILATQTGALIWFVTSFVEAVPDLGETLDNYIESQIDAGFEDPPLRGDDPLLRGRKVLLFQDVNSRTAKEVSARLMYLDALDPKTPIDLYISTQGGWTDNAFTIIDTIRTISAPVNTWAIGGCYSAGALILVTATGRRYVTEDAILMVHANLEKPTGDHSYPKLALERYEDVWKHHSSLPSSWYPMTTDEEHYLSPEEALQFHVVDEIVPVGRSGRAGGRTPAVSRPLHRGHR